MTRIAAYQHGVYPRSQALVAATRDLDRGRTTPGAVEVRIRLDVEEFVEVQRQAGLDYYSDGMLRWHDVFRPIVETAHGLSAGPLVRWFDNNAFFRAPELDGELSAPPVGALLVDGELVPPPRVTTLPSPYLFSRVAIAERDRNQLMVEFAASVLRPLAQDLAQHSVDVIHLQEPWLATHGIEGADWPVLERALEEVRGGWPGQLVLHLPFGDVGRWAARLRELPVDAIGIDFVETDLDSLGRHWGVGVLVGCLDGRTSQLEVPEATVEFARRVLERLQPPVLYVSSATDLDLLPRSLAQRKVSLLGECARALKGVLAA
jgi:5-methyltetrahydropteroyltriglutamate--homocysteine methyltransferase